MLAREEQQVVIDRLKEAEAEREQAMKALEAAKRVAEDLEKKQSKDMVNVLKEQSEKQRQLNELLRAKEEAKKKNDSYQNALLAAEEEAKKHKDGKKKGGGAQAADSAPAKKAGGGKKKAASGGGNGFTSAAVGVFTLAAVVGGAIVALGGPNEAIRFLRGLVNA